MHSGCSIRIFRRVLSCFSVIVLESSAEYKTQHHKMPNIPRPNLPHRVIYVVMLLLVATPMAAASSQGSVTLENTGGTNGAAGRSVEHLQALAMVVFLTIFMLLAPTN